MFQHKFSKTPSEKRFGFENPTAAENREHDGQDYLLHGDSIVNTHLNHLPPTTPPPPQVIETTPALIPGWNDKPDFLDLSPSWKTIAVIKTDDLYDVIAELLTPPPVCLRCGPDGTELRSNGTLLRSLIDEPLHGRRVRINYLRRRYRCSCGCNLIQTLPDTHKGRSITERAALYAAVESLSRSFEDVADELDCSSKTIKNLFADRIVKLETTRTLECPEVLGIDGVCIGRNKHKRSYCMLTDLTEHRVVELLPKSTELELARFLKQLPHPERLKVVVIDMARGFLVVVRKIFPHAIVVIDAFHVLRMINDALTEFLRLIQGSLDEAGREELMREGNRFLLLTRRFELTVEQREQLQRWFNRVPALKQAYDLKEEVYDIWRLSERAEAEKRYDAWLKKIPREMEPAFKKFTGAVRRWRPYIFNFFDFRVTNAYTESRNRDVKTLQRQGRRTSFQVLRARLLYVDILLKHHCHGRKASPQQLRRVLRESGHERRLPSASRDSHSYLARMDQARKSRNEFSRLMRPPTSWSDRFGHYSRYSEEASPVKWDFLW